MSDDIIISLKGVKKDFHLPRHKNNSLKELVTQVFKKKDKNVDVHHALRGITFDIKRGEFFGILGRNGTGKSTLLKILAEIYQPTSGSVKVRGKLVPFIELGVGFNPNLTGRENVYLNGALLGFSKKEIDQRYDSIVKFAELQEFMDQKLRNYSSGMKVRLAFSVAIQADADILLLDEVLAVGDAAFQKKCYDYFDTLKERKKTIVFVSHSMSAVRKYCDRAVLIEKGKVILEDGPDVIADAYNKMFQESLHRDDGRFGTGEVLIKDVSVDVSKRNIIFDVDLHSKSNFLVNMAVDVYKDGRLVAGESTKGTGKKTISVTPSGQKVSITMPNIFGGGDYTASISVKGEDNEVYDFIRQAAKFNNTFVESTYLPIVMPTEFSPKGE